MSRITLGQITLHRDKTISMTKKYYLLQPSSAAAPTTTNYGITPPTYTQTGYSGWSSTEPNYTVGDDRVLYELSETIYSDNTWDYSTPTISSSYEAAKAAYDEVIQAEATLQEFTDLGLKKGYIWDNGTYVAESGSVPEYPVGSYIASGMLVGGERTITRSNSNTYGLNTWISTGGINLRYNAIDLMKLTTSNLEFYYPSTSSQQKKAISLGTNNAINSLAFYGFNSNNKTMELTNGGLYFYNPSDGSTELASFTSNGLVLKAGGIKAGSSRTDNFVYLSSANFADTISGHNAGTVSLDDYTATDWRQLIGTKFGVRADGTLYASNANISGIINATSFTATYTNGNTVYNTLLNGNGLIVTDGSNNVLSKFGALTTIGRESGNNYNINITNTSIDLRYNTNILNRISSNGLTIYDGSGVNDSNKLAFFGTTAQVGRTTSNHISITSDALSIWDGIEIDSGGSYYISNRLAYFGANEVIIGRYGSSSIHLSSTGLTLKDGRDASYGYWGIDTGQTTLEIGYQEFVTEEDGQGVEIPITENVTIDCIYQTSYGTNYNDFSVFYNGNLVTKSQTYYTYTIDTSNEVISFELKTLAITNQLGFKEGDVISIKVSYTKINDSRSYLIVGTPDDDLEYGINSVSVGNKTSASGSNAFAQGYGVSASGPSSFASGYNTQAIGSYSQALGEGSVAKGVRSFASGGFVTAYEANQTVIGRSNSEGRSKNCAFVIGNGTFDKTGSLTRSNAFSVDWGGNVTIPQAAKIKLTQENPPDAYICADDYLDPNSQLRYRNMYYHTAKTYPQGYHAFYAGNENSAGVMYIRNNGIQVNKPIMSGASTRPLFKLKIGQYVGSIGTNSQTIYSDTDMAITNYTPIGIVGINMNGSNTGKVWIRSFTMVQISSGGSLKDKIMWEVYNNSGSTISSATITGVVLYIENTQDIPVIT